MKKLILLLAAFFAVSIAFAQTQVKPTRIAPTAYTRVQKMQIVDNEVQYDLVVSRGLPTSLYADLTGKLIGLSVGASNAPVVKARLKVVAGKEAWDMTGTSATVEVDIAAWTKFFNERVAHVTAVDTRRTVSVERDVTGAPIQWEFVGYSASANGSRQVLIRQVNDNDAMKSFGEGEFFVLPPKNRTFYLGTYGGKFCAVEEQAVGIDTVTFLAVELDPPATP